MIFSLSHFTTSDEEKLMEIRFRKVYNFIITEIDSSLTNKIYFDPVEQIMDVKNFSDINTKDKMYHVVTIDVLAQ
jgi:hypothetical protein